MIKDLEFVGFHKNEARTYEALVKFGPCKAGLLINKLDIHRNLVYQALENLVLKGYVTKYINKNVWHFQITDPHGLLAEAKRKEVIVSQLVKEIATYQHKALQQIVVYEGIESYRNYWIQSLERVPSGTIDYCVGTPTTESWINLLGSSYKQYLELRLKKRIHWKTVLFKIEEGERKMLRDHPDLTEYRLWVRDIDCIGNFNVLHDTVILHTVTDPPRIIEIRDASMVLIFRNYFDMMWAKAKPITRV